MQSTITRLALFQFLAVVYCVLGIALVLKIRASDPSPAVFATYLRNFGAILLLLPAAWLLWASHAANQPRKETGDFDSILGSGFVVLVLILLLAIAGTISALPSGSGTLVKKAEPAKPAKKAILKELQGSGPQ